MTTDCQNCQKLNELFFKGLEEHKAKYNEKLKSAQSIKTLEFNSEKNKEDNKPIRHNGSVATLF